MMINTATPTNAGYVAPYTQPSQEEQLGKAQMSAPAETQEAVPPSNETDARQPEQEQTGRQAKSDERMGGMIDAYA